MVDYPPFASGISSTGAGGDVLNLADLLTTGDNLAMTAVASRLQFSDGGGVVQTIDLTNCRQYCCNSPDECIVDIRKH